MMRRMRVTCSAMPPRMVTAPPDRPVPAPRGTTGMRCLAAILITSDTCCVLDASTTASGMAPSIEPSRSKLRSSWWDAIAASRPTAGRSSWATDSGRGILKRLETARHRAWDAAGLGRLKADDEQGEPAPAFFIGRRAVEALENGLLDSVVRRDLDREPDRKAVGGDCVMGLVHLAVDGQAERLRLCRGAQAGRLALDVHLVRPLLTRWSDRPRTGPGSAGRGGRPSPTPRCLGPRTSRRAVAR